MKNFVFVLTILLYSFNVYSQSVQTDYLEGKRLFNNKQYLSARAIFSNLTRSNSALAPYAGFYYGLSAFKMDDTDDAVRMWKQMLNQYPKWDKRNELLFWLAYSQLKAGQYSEGISYTTMLSEATVNNAEKRKLLEKFVMPLSIDSIAGFLHEFPEDKLLAELYVKKTNTLPYTERNFETLDSLANVYDLEAVLTEIVDLPVIKKKQYKIAAVFPFMFDTLSNPGRVLQNSLVTDLYQGMLQASEDLQREGKPVEIIPYDTKRDALRTVGILTSPGFADTDLIVGPLYSGPVKVVQDYALENKMDMVNPISSTSEIIGRNPFSFLFMPTIETQTVELAELAIAEETNKNAMIFYETNPKDSLAAVIYREKMEEAGFNIIWMQPINNENSKRILDSLVAQYDVYLTKEEADSIMTIPDRVVRSRRVRDYELQLLKKYDPTDSLSFFIPVSYDDNHREIVYYEKQFYMKKDSVGHFFGAISSNVLASNLISAVEIRGDSTSIYTYGDWLNYTMADYRQFERLGITLADPKYINKDRPFYQSLTERITEKYMTIPSIYHYTGYELTWFLGNMLHANGKYFQVGIRDGKIYYGKIFEGSAYGLANDNQVVPIIRFKNHELKVVNREFYGNRTK